MAVEIFSWPDLHERMWTWCRSRVRLQQAIANGLATAPGKYSEVQLDMDLHRVACMLSQRDYENDDFQQLLFLK